MFTPPLEIIYMIADYIPPSFNDYCRLATVSRDFYTVFTSDKVWQYLDAYGVKTNIFHNFREEFHKDKFTGKLLNSKSRTELCSLDLHALQNVTTNRYVWLQCFLARPGTYYPTSKQYPELVKAYFSARPNLCPGQVSQREYDRELALMFIGYDGNHLSDFRGLSDDRDVAKLAVSTVHKWQLHEHDTQNLYRPTPLQFVSRRLQEDEEIIELALAADARAIRYVPSRLKRKYRERLDWRSMAIKNCVSFIEDWPVIDDIKTIYNILNYTSCPKAAFQVLIGYGNKFFSESLLENPEFCQLAIDCHPGNVFLLAPNNPELLRIALRKGAAGPLKVELDPDTLREALEEWGPKVRSDIEISRLLIENYMEHYLGLSSEMQQKEEIQMCFVRQNWLGICGLDNNARGQLSLNIEALKGLESPNDWEAGYVLENILTNHEYLAKVLEAGVSPMYLDLKLGTRFAEDRDLVLKFYKHPKLPRIGESKRYELPSTYYNDFEVVLAAVTRWGCLLDTITGPLRHNKQILAAAFGPKERLCMDRITDEYCWPYAFIPRDLLEDHDCMLELISRCGIVPPEYTASYQSYAHMLTVHPYSFEHLPKIISHTPEVQIEAVRAYARNLNFVELNENTRDALLSVANFESPPDQKIVCRKCKDPYLRHSSFMFS